jgi:hypothetical protein
LHQKTSRNQKKDQRPDKIAEELEKEVNQGSLQFKELMRKARHLRKVFDELDNEHAERESTGVPGHVKDNTELDQARNKLHQVYHSIRSYLEQNAPQDKGIKLAPFEPKKLKTKEPLTKQNGQGWRRLQEKESRRREVSSQCDVSGVGLPRQPDSAEAVSGKQGPQLQGEADQPAKRN